MTQPSKVRTSLDNRRKALFSRATSDVLIQSLLSFDQQPVTQERRIARAWIIEELERRFPAASELVEQAFAAADAKERTTGEPVEVDYAAVLVDAIRSTTRS